LNKENLTTGVPAGEVKINHFVMAHIRIQNFSPLHLLLKKPIRFIYAVVKKQVINHFVMGLMQSCNEWESRYQQGQTGWDRGEISPNLHYWLERNLLNPCRIQIPGVAMGMKY
jgi:hypothetical protein